MGLKSWFSDVMEKLNPAQRLIQMEAGESQGTGTGYTNYLKAYDDFTVVRRGVDLIVNGCSSFDYNVADKINGLTPVTESALRKNKLAVLLNYSPNPYQDQNKFRRLIFTDIVIEGNAFIYFDGVYLYHLPSHLVEILPDKSTHVRGYKFSGEVTFDPTEIIHIADNSATSNYRGTSRLKSSTASLDARNKMTKFQSNFFKNGAVPGLVLRSPNVLGDRVKQRLIESWIREYNPERGGKRPLILDGGLDVAKISDASFRELDFEGSVSAKDDEILMSLGVPAILLKGGNNANITPNVKLFYLETVLPIVRMVNSGFERYFGYNLEPETSKVSALQPEMADSAGYYTTLVNGGVISPNEARVELRREPITGHDDLRIPANIAGSASDPSTGGKPKGDNNK